MAERRMFAKSVVDSDVFLDMPLTARLLYYDLGMRADDDGFVGSPKKIMRMVGASQDDLRILIARRFVIPFESGVVVIRHWKQNNYLRPDRHTPTVYADEFALLTESKTGTYEPMTELGIPDANQVVDDRYTQVREDKDSKGKYKNTLVESGEKKVRVKENYEEDFAEFWSLYPRKDGRKDALKSYTRARKNGASKEAILSGAKAYVEQCKSQKTEKRYIAMPTTWLNQERWGWDYSDGEPFKNSVSADFDIEEHVRQMQEEGLL